MDRLFMATSWAERTRNTRTGETGVPCTRRHPRNRRISEQPRPDPPTLAQGHFSARTPSGRFGHKLRGVRSPPAPIRCARYCNSARQRPKSPPPVPRAHNCLRLVADPHPTAAWPTTDRGLAHSKISGSATAATESRSQSFRPARV